MEKNPRDRLRILGTAELLVVVFIFLVIARMATEARQPGGDSAYLVPFLMFLLPFLVLLVVLGFAALSGKSWGFPLAAVVVVLFFVFAAVQTRLALVTTESDGLKTVLFITWPLAIYHAFLSILYRKFLKELEP